MYIFFTGQLLTINLDSFTFFESILLRLFLVSGLLIAVFFLFSINTVDCQQQYFRVQPRDVKVHEGGEVMLECEVANLAGQVQWTKDGFALGKK